MPLNIPDGLVDLIAVGVSVLTAGGLVLDKVLQRRNESKKIRVDASRLALESEKLDDQKLSNDVGAAKELANILKSVVEPISNRVTALENEAIQKSRQITELNSQVFSLQRQLAEKDLELIKLRREYQNQVEISEKQAVKIKELESQIELLRKKEGSC